MPLVFAVHSHSPPLSLSLIYTYVHTYTRRHAHTHAHTRAHAGFSFSLLISHTSPLLSLCHSHCLSLTHTALRRPRWLARGIGMDKVTFPGITLPAPAVRSVLDTLSCLFFSLLLC